MVQKQEIKANMQKSQVYKSWIENSLARASGDMIVDALNSAVDFGALLNIEAFLKLLLNDLDMDGKLGRKEFSELIKNDNPKWQDHKYFSIYEEMNNHEYNSFIQLFERFLLEKIFKMPFIRSSNKTISEELKKIALERRILIKRKAKESLNALMKFSQHKNWRKI